MPARRPNLSNAAIELTAVVLAAALGAAGAPLWAGLLLVAAAIAYWLWSRRAALGAMRRERPGALIGSTLVALAVLGGVIGAAFLFGSFLHGARS
jgi:hypothetical protein